MNPSTNTQDVKPKFPRLHGAAGSDGSVQDVRKRIKAGAKPNAKDPTWGYTALHTFARFNREDIEIIKTLIKGGADVNDKANNGNTPLHEAAMHNDNANIIKELIKAGADINARNNHGFTPLHSAARFSKSVEIIRTLIEEGASIYTEDIVERTPYSHLVQYNSLLKDSPEARKLLCP